ncbi:hypothetical protein E6H36_09505 [Candidatus Bathyarchaeota archaeon]|nr:MAG: hypothetical protein E6H36_09505 [Candidatus Bathyarchaeota archaeon]TMI33173.1 MAG: hypothetical protein E6H29_00935 [Candidatus Bathyarchaeota archaeon]
MKHKFPRKTSKSLSGRAVLDVRVELPSARIAEIVSSSISPETHRAKGIRSATSIRSKRNALELEIQARDLVALRASANSFLRLAAAASRTIDTVAPFYRGRHRRAVSNPGTSV